MENREPEKQPQVCIIKVVFPAESDDAALDIKKKIGVIVEDTPGVQINFNLLAGHIPTPGR